MSSGNFHYYLCAKLNAEATSGTQKLHGYWENQLNLDAATDASSYMPPYFLPDLLALHYEAIQKC